MTPRHDRNTVPALILGTGLTVLGVVRCLARAGVRSYCVSEGLGFEAHSRWCRRTDARVDAFGDISSLVRVLESTGLAGGVLVPCSDHWTVELGKLPAALRDRFRAFVPEPDVVAGFIDKVAFARLLESAGVPHPTTALLTGERELDTALRRMPAGVFLKPANSQRFLSEFHVKAFRVGTLDEARERFRAAARVGLDVLLQEYIPGPSDLHYFIDGFVDGGHRIAATFARRRLRMYPPDFGNSSYMVSVSPETVESARSALAALFQRSHYRGIFSAEFKLDPRDGVFKLIEVNCRPWWYVEFAATCGVNVVAMAYTAALGPPGAAGTPPSYRAGVGLVHAYPDYFACRRLRREGALTLGAWARSWMTARKAVFCWDDPVPALAKLAGRARDRMRSPA